jgi:RHS repeat-associated protein
LLTTRNTGQDILQDLNYEFDAVGNIIEIRDDAQQTIYFDNQVIAPVSTFEYDALYRLIQATGRELTALTAPDENDFANDIPVHNIDPNAMQNYTHNYEYDALGNMLSDNWKTYEYDFAATIGHSIELKMVNNYLIGHDSYKDKYTYDAHGNMLAMPHLSSMEWDYADRLFSATNGTFTSYYNYDAEGNRTRKVVEKGNIVEERYYIGGYEVYRKYVNGTLDLERSTVNISDDEKVFVRVETETGEDEVVRYQYDNHLGSACLELDEDGLVISYEEYHPFGTTSYRAGRGETEVSLKRYKYCGKERDEETGLYYYGARYYAAWLRRFISCDVKATDYPHVNPYNYCLNSPINLVDPTGMRAEKPDDPPQQNEHNSTENAVSAAAETEAVAINTDNVLFSGNAKSSDVSQYTKELVSQIATEMGVTTLTISSTKRTLESQIDAMYTNTVNQGVDAQKELYGTKGKDVISAYETAQKEGKTEEEIKSAMTQKATDVGFVSTHMSSDYDKLNAIDFGYSQFTESQKTSFADAVKTVNTTLDEDLQIKIITEKNCFHLDIPQKK